MQRDKASVVAVTSSQQPAGFLSEAYVGRFSSLWTEVCEDVNNWQGSLWWWWWWNRSVTREFAIWKYKEISPVVLGEDYSPKAMYADDWTLVSLTMELIFRPPRNCDHPAVVNILPSPPSKLGNLLWFQLFGLLTEIAIISLQRRYLSLFDYEDSLVFHKQICTGGDYSCLTDGVMWERKSQRTCK